MRKKKMVFSTEPFPLNYPEYHLLAKPQTRHQDPTLSHSKSLADTSHHLLRSPIDSLPEVHAKEYHSKAKEYHSRNQEYHRTPGVEMSRLTQALEQQVLRERGIGLGRKENMGDGRQSRSICQQRQVSSSDLRLPSVKHYPENEEESKLMEQIRRVENKIRELRHERNQFGSQQGTFQMLRPFLEVQNQNMVNLQMLILAQNKIQNAQNAQNAQNSRCCQVAPQPSSSLPPPYPLYPPFYGYSPQHSQDVEGDEAEEEGWPQPNAHNIHNPQNSRGPVIEGRRALRRRGKGVQKKYNMTKIRKFRVAVIAVYFSLLFPKFANRFTMKRYRLHCQEYIEGGKEFNSCGPSFVDDLLHINMVEVSKNVRDQKLYNPGKFKGEAAKIMISEQHEGKQNFEFSIGDIEIFLLEFLKKLEERLEETELEETVRHMMKGNMPGAFPIDDYHFFEEIYRMRYHPGRLYLRLTREESKALVMSFFFLKLFLGEFLFVVKDNFEWKKKIMKWNQIRNSDMIEIEIATTELYFSGILLHGYCMDLIKEELASSTGNAHALDPERLPIPLKMMFFNNIGELEEALGAKKAVSKRKEPQEQEEDEEEEDLEETLYKRLDIEQYRGEKLYRFEYVKNLESFRTLIGMIQKTSDFEQEVKEKLLDITDMVYDKMVAQRKEEYRRIKEELLLEQKNMLRKKVDYGGIKMGKRNAQEKKFMRQIAQLMRDNRNQEIQSREGEEGGEEEGGEEEGEKGEGEEQGEEEEEEEGGESEQPEGTEEERSSNKSSKASKSSK